jgi:hypothetical protein
MTADEALEARETKMKAVKPRANPLPALDEAIPAPAAFDKLNHGFRQLTAFFLAGFDSFGLYLVHTIKPNTSP